MRNNVILERKEPPERREGSPEPKPSSAGRLVSALPEVFLAVAAIFLFVHAGSFEGSTRPGQLGPDFWPRMICVGILAGASLRTIQKLFLHPAPEKTSPGEKPDEKAHWRRFGLGAVLVIGYMVSTLYIGFVIATAVFLPAFLHLGGRRGWHIFPVGVVSSLVFAYVALEVVYISLPSGVGVFDAFSVALYRLMGIY